MTTIILIRHAPTQPDKNQHSTQWQLTDEAQTLCHALAKEIEGYKLRKIYTSTEPKAQATGQFVAEKVGNIPVEIAENLHETERESKQFYESQDEFREAVKQAMLSPDELLFGDETFAGAGKRLAKQIKSLAKQNPDETIGIISHGRILAMYLTGLVGESPVEIWEKLQMPAYAVLSWDEQTITKIQYAIEAK